jgi:hypothetical protein
MQMLSERSPDNHVEHSQIGAKYAIRLTPNASIRSPYRMSSNGRA